MKTNRHEITQKRRLRVALKQQQFTINSKFELQKKPNTRLDGHTFTLNIS